MIPASVFSNRIQTQLARKQYGVEERLLRAFHGLYQDSNAALRVGDEMTDWFEVERGIKQWCLMSP